MNRQTQKYLIAVGVTLLLLSGVIFYYQKIKIPKVSRAVETSVRAEIDEQAMEKRLVWVVADERGISRYTEMTEEYIAQSLVQKEIPLAYLTEGAITDLNQIKGKITRESLAYGQQLLPNFFMTQENWYGDYDRLKEFPVKSLVADEVKTGNLVDVLVHYGNGDYDVVVPKIKVQRIVYPLINEESGENGEALPYTILLAVEEVDYRDLTLAKELGHLETRLYLDQEQPPSVKTFNYEKALKRSNIPTNQEKGMVIQENVTPPMDEDQTIREKRGN